MTAGQPGRWREVVKKRIKVLNRESSSDYYANKNMDISIDSQMSEHNGKQGFT